MATKKTNNTKKKEQASKNKNKRTIKTRGRIFEGEVIKKLPGRITITQERMVKIPKYERYEKRRMKLHAKLPKEMQETIQVGDRIRIGETRPISKTIHFIVLNKITKEKKE
jgi:small subunit ribosomal protein S17